uniref:Uncharacterized protein n=1 Tax=virus sp. ct1Uu26 TaxID=2826789 RepID=A0A8S5R7X6_9VIRU|nr:MAG TPA: hypothetical protein [virus sp. ct1Uu26]
MKETGMLRLSCRLSELAPTPKSIIWPPERVLEYRLQLQILSLTIVTLTLRRARIGSWKILARILALRDLQERISILLQEKINLLLLPTILMKSQKFSLHEDLLLITKS